MYVIIINNMVSFNKLLPGLDLGYRLQILIGVSRN